MDRIHYLEPYSQIYFVAEFARLKAALTPLLALNPQKRRARIQVALSRYLRALVGVEVGNLLTDHVCGCAAVPPHAR